MFNIFKRNKKEKSLLQNLVIDSRYIYEMNIKELYEWLKGERYGYFLEDHKTWINYGSLVDKFPYDEDKKQWELSRNRMIEKTLRKIEELGLIELESEE
jgi:hypothetical protein